VLLSPRTVWPAGAERVLRLSYRHPGSRCGVELVQSKSGFPIFVPEHLLVKKGGGVPNLEPARHSARDPRLRKFSAAQVRGASGGRTTLWPAQSLRYDFRPGHEAIDDLPQRVPERGQRVVDARRHNRRLRIDHRRGGRASATPAPRNRDLPRPVGTLGVRRRWPPVLR